MDYFYLLNSISNDPPPLPPKPDENEQQSDTIESHPLMKGMYRRDDKSAEWAGTVYIK